MTDQRYEAVVVGTGFGGAVTACRLARRWPGDVAVLERGRRYPMGSFPRAPEEMARNFWTVESGEPGAAAEDNCGLFDVRRVGRMDAIVAAGVGGGSLLYANVFMSPPPEVFADPRWPSTCTPESLAPYYRVAREVFAPRPVPIDDAARRVRRRDLFEDAASAMGRTSTPAEVSVFFGPPDGQLLEPGRTGENRYGVSQTSCTYCGECDIGCNVHAKTTVDLNYLHRAEHAHGATVLAGHRVDSILPLSADGELDPEADGTSGYEVSGCDLDSGEPFRIRTRRVVVAAGTLGSVELLLRARDLDRTLPRISGALGRGFSGNGDFLMFVAGIDRPTDPTRGPVITQYTDFGLFADARPDGFVLEDAGYPTLLAWFVEGAKPTVLKRHAVAESIRRVFARAVLGRSGGKVGSHFGALLRHGLTEGSAVLLFMGRDSSTGRLHLDRHGRLDGTWPRRRNRRLYRAIVDAGHRFGAAVGATKVFATPTWWWPFRRNVTVHPLGGAGLADDPDHGVVSAHPADFGRVFGYQNLYVADGSIIPAAVGANPAATITALAERVAEGITGHPPDADL